ncbi:gliding motility-associated C-terminal domain-containing protein [Pedobacter sp. SD-b]|uniref:Gliding motility-associated C-terminal domain-containing protein n=1 Tax=Pedobacter segetis TaxID=2793069 RepID=A0ABS1BI57_9SPHI|nr:gliding motility-associated C-terminal domain-containing protein [Pedobacter segetis]MBK0381879.1 gliding motility-associated C-terminal domain-containing protein [Pedobacter segetis]
MKIKFTYSFFSFLVLIFIGKAGHAQFVNNGSPLIIQNGAVLFVSGDFVNQSNASIINLGDITLTGNWINNDSQGAFNVVSSGNVNFLGADQSIGGSQKTNFPNVVLGGTGVKKLLFSTDILGTLNLTDRELAVDAQNLSILKNDVAAITFTSGFISTDGKGFLYRNTNISDSYVFPLGSNLKGSFIYRPVNIKPLDNANNSFGVSFINNDPTTEGYNRQQKRFDVNEVNPNYFHILNQRQGASLANFDFFYSTTDGNVNQLVNWIPFNLWEKAGISNPRPFSGGNAQLNQVMTFSSLKRVNNLPMSLANILANNDPITFFNSFSPDGDGRNDRWEIKNIDLFPDNELTIINRWGSEVFKAKNYKNSEAWDGAGLNNGTYFYLLKVTVNSEPKVYKGFITLLRHD